MGLEDWVVDSTGGIFHQCAILCHDLVEEYDWWVVYNIKAKDIRCAVCDGKVPLSVIDAARLAGSEGVKEWEIAMEHNTNWVGDGLAMKGRSLLKK